MVLKKELYKKAQKIKTNGHCVGLSRLNKGQLEDYIKKHSSSNPQTQPSKPQPSKPQASKPQASNKKTGEIIIKKKQTPFLMLTAPTPKIDINELINKAKTRQALRRLLLMYHPDKGGSEENAKLITQAMENMQKKKQERITRMKERMKEREDNKKRKRRNALMKNYAEKYEEAFFRLKSINDKAKWIEIINQYPILTINDVRSIAGQSLFYKRPSEEQLRKELPTLDLSIFRRVK